MPAFQEMAGLVVAEIPVPRLQLLLNRVPGDDPAFDGFLCGGNCAGKDGAFCGSGCNPQGNASDVIDRDGHQLRLTPQGLSDIRYDLPKLRQAIIGQIDLNLARLK